MGPDFRPRKHTPSPRPRSTRASIPADGAHEPSRPPPRHGPAGARGPAPLCLLAPLPDRGSLAGRPWPRRPSASTTGTGRTSWPWCRRPATPPRPGGAWRPRRPGPTGAALHPLRRDPARGLAGRSGRSIPRRPRATETSWRRSSAWGSTAGSGTPRSSWSLPAPSTVAARLGGGRLAAHLREWPGLVGDALRALAETQIRFAELCLGEGLAGVLYTVHAPDEPALGASAYAELLEPHDRAVLAALDGRASAAGGARHRTGALRAGGDLARRRGGLGSGRRPAGARRRSCPAARPPRSAGSMPRRSATSPRRRRAAARAALASVGERGLVVGPGRARLAGHAGRGADRRRPGARGLHAADPRPQPADVPVRGAARASPRAPSRRRIRATCAW